jgi:hypothetical protein
VHTGFLEGNREGRRPLGRPKRGRENNIKNESLRSGIGARTGSIWQGIETDGELL